MNIKNLIISSLIGGIIIAALANIPVIQLINCLLCTGYWIGSILAVWLYKRFQGSLTLGQGVAIGALAGVWSGLINFILGLISAAGIATIISAVDQVIPAETLDLQGNFIGQHGNPGKRVPGIFQYFPGDHWRPGRGCDIPDKTEVGGTSGERIG